MSKIEVFRQKQRLDSLFQMAKKIPGDVEVQSHWAKYLCVLASGYLEHSIRTLYSNYAKTTASPNVARFVDNSLKSFQNPKMEKILEIARSFSPDWESQLKKATEGELKDSVDSIVSNRHLIAHGCDVGITYSRIQQYYGNAVKVVELVEKLCDGKMVC